jgi:anti-anti-sigma factor
MSIRINKRSNDKFVIYQLEGRLDTAGSAILKLDLDMETQNPKGNIVLEMSKVTFISSAGIGVTVKSHSLLKQKGFEMRVAAANEEVKKIYDLLGFSHVIHLYATLNDALKD